MRRWKGQGALGIPVSPGSVEKRAAVSETGSSVAGKEEETLRRLKRRRRRCGTLEMVGLISPKIIILLNAIDNTINSSVPMCHKT